MKRALFVIALSASACTTPPPAESQREGPAPAAAEDVNTDSENATGTESPRGVEMAADGPKPAPMPFGAGSFGEWDQERARRETTVDKSPVEPLPRKAPAGWSEKYAFVGVIRLVGQGPKPQTPVIIVDWLAGSVENGTKVLIVDGSAEYVNFAEVKRVWFVEKRIDQIGCEVTWDSTEQPVTRGHFVVALKP